MNDDEVFLATEVTDPFERRGLCAGWENASYLVRICGILIRNDDLKNDVFGGTRIIVSVSRKKHASKHHEN